MEHLTAALAAPRLLRHARRGLLLLGAAFVWWLLFSGGPAQADGGSAHHALDPGAPVTHTTRAADDLVRTVPHRVTERLTTATRTAPEPVRELLGTATAALEPSLTRTTSTVADTLDGTVDRAVETVRPTLATVTGAASPVAASRPAAPAPVTARTAHRQQVPDAVTAAPSGGSTTTFLAVVDAQPDSRGEPVETPADRTPSAPASPAAPAVPGGSTGAPGSPWAALAGFLIVPPATRRLRRAGGRSARRPDPAYTPGCSPD
jgi:hypothetical protein